MSNTQLNYCLQLLAAAIQALEQPADLEIAVNNVRHVVFFLQQSSFDSNQVVLLLDRAITYMESQPFMLVSNRNLGRPKLMLPAHCLEYLLSLNFNVPAIAKLLGVSTRTIHRRFSDLNLSVCSHKYRKLNPSREYYLNEMQFLD